MKMASVSKRVIADDNVKENETFTVSLSVDKRITIGNRNTVTVL